MRYGIIRPLHSSVVRLLSYHHKVALLVTYFVMLRFGGLQDIAAGYSLLPQWPLMNWKSREPDP